MHKAEIEAAKEMPNNSNMKPYSNKKPKIKLIVKKNTKKEKIFSYTALILCNMGFQLPRKVQLAEDMLFDTHQ